MRALARRVQVRHRRSFTPLPTSPTELSEASCWQTGRGKTGSGAAKATMSSGPAQHADLFNRAILNLILESPVAIHVPKLPRCKPPPQTLCQAIATNLVARSEE